MTVCLPTSRDGGGIDEPDWSLCCYKESAAKLGPPAQLDILGTFQPHGATLKKPQMLCAPCRHGP